MNIKTDYCEKSIEAQFIANFDFLAQKVSKLVGSPIDLMSNTVCGNYKNVRTPSYQCKNTLLTVREVEKRLRIGHTALYERILAPNLLPSVKVGGKRLIRLEDLDTFIERNRTGISYA